VPTIIPEEEPAKESKGWKVLGVIALVVVIGVVAYLICRKLMFRKSQTTNS
jgi:hypothetical protein